MVTSTRLAAAFAAAAVAVLVASFALAGGASAQTTNGALAINPATTNVAPGGAVSVTLVATAPTGNLGGWDVNVAFNTSVLTFNNCTTDVSTSCASSGSGVVRVAGVATTQAGISGTVTLGTLNFTAASTAGTSNLTITATEFVTGPAAPATPAITNGVVNVAVATASPTASPAPATTAASIPNTGGSPDGSSVSPMFWVLAAASLIIVSAAGWAVSRARREI
jgi:hypothetical protein